MDFLMTLEFETNHLLYQLAKLFFIHIFNRQVEPTAAIRELHAAQRLTEDLHFGWLSPTGHCSMNKANRSLGYRRSSSRNPGR
jgi:hypothetical protein